MIKRYLKEYINDKKLSFKDDKTAYNNFCIYSDKVLAYTRRGLITNIEAVRMIDSIDFWQLRNEDFLKTRFS